MSIFDMIDGRTFLHPQRLHAYGSTDPPSEVPVFRETSKARSYADFKNPKTFKGGTWISRSCNYGQYIVYGLFWTCNYPLPGVLGGYVR